MRKYGFSKTKGNQRSMGLVLLIIDTYSLNQKWKTKVKGNLIVRDQRGETKVEILNGD